MKSIMSKCKGPFKYGIMVDGVEVVETVESPTPLNDVQKSRIIWDFANEQLASPTGMKMVLIQTKYTARLSANDCAKETYVA